MSVTQIQNTNMNIFSAPSRSLRLHSQLFSPFLAQKQRQRLHSKGSVCLKRTWKHSMLANGRPVLKDGNLNINGEDALTDVPENIVVTPLTDTSAFVGATSTERLSRHVFKLGVIQDVRLLCLFRFKTWWMIPRVGNSASDIPIETQMLLLEAREGPTCDASDNSTSYILFLPLLDGEFRSSLQGNLSNEVQFCVESGDPAIVTSESLQAVFVNFGDHPFDLVNKSMKILEKHMGTFALRETKQMPGMLDWFGWCTWDAFYQQVNPQGIKEGLKSLSEGGTPAKFLIIDDGWQDTINEFQKKGEPYVEGSQFGGTLASIKENNKFRFRGTAIEEQSEATSLKDFVSDIKKTFSLKYVYVWHALMGYWGGLVPDAAGTEKYNPTLRYPIQSPGNLANIRDISMDCMEKYGVGTIDTSKVSQFYDDLHSYLVSQDVDGVKVDVQNILETISSSLGGRVSLTRQFQQALEESVATNFQDNSIICCMGQSTDSIYHSKRSAITRASDDYYPKNPTTQTLHIAAVAFNSIFLGEVFVPDWDMFYSLHCAAEYHAVARAVGGCGVYVSDKPGKHDFNILKRLVLSDGSVLRAKYPGRPSRDCLFTDPVTDGKSLLKIWNLNKCTGVIGVFNCQGAGTWPCMENTVQKDVAAKICGQVSPWDIEYFEEITGKQWTGDCAVFSFKSGSLFQLAKEKSFSIALKVMQCDVFTVSPIKVYNQKIKFAAIGLMNMYNSGGAVESVDLIKESSSNCRMVIKGRGGGSFGAYSSTKPKSCLVNSKKEDFKFSAEDKLLTISIPSKTTCWEIAIIY